MKRLQKDVGGQRWNGPEGRLKHDSNPIVLIKSTAASLNSLLEDSFCCGHTGTLIMPCYEACQSDARVAVFTAVKER